MQISIVCLGRFIYKTHLCRKQNKQKTNFPSGNVKCKLWRYFHSDKHFHLKHCINCAKTCFSSSFAFRKHACFSRVAFSTFDFIFRFFSTIMCMLSMLCLFFCDFLHIKYNSYILIWLINVVVEHLTKIMAICPKGLKSYIVEVT